MKQEFTAAVKALGGTTRYSGGGEQAVLTEKTQQVHRVPFGRKMVGDSKYQGYRKPLVAFGYFAGRKLIAISKGTPTMYVKGLTEDTANELAKLYEGKTIPFQVIFQNN